MNLDLAKKLVAHSEGLELDLRVLEQNEVLLDSVSAGVLNLNKLQIPHETEPFTITLPASSQHRKPSSKD
ncbi:MAG TPA: hypothetical protein VFF30_00245 [Nitrososphaerales archaeon]|nr:hypothetical protein [Nitrososphaerales archaeon]